MSLEEILESLDETNDEIVAKIIKDKELFISKYKLMKKKQAEFVVANVRLRGEFEKLEKARKALESEHSLLMKSHEQLQTPLTITNAPSTSTSSCDHTNIIEENARLKDELAKVSSPQNDKPLYEVMKEKKASYREGGPWLCCQEEDEEQEQEEGHAFSSKEE